ncbi:MAG: hypothetical protein QM765_20305 [Myxococcales bacterium]
MGDRQQPEPGSETGGRQAELRGVLQARFETARQVRGAEHHQQGGRKRRQVGEAIGDPLAAGLCQSEHRQERDEEEEPSRQEPRRAPANRKGGERDG